MKILLIGSGGREHALAWKLKQSPLCKELICAPGNAGVAEIAACVPIDIDDIEAITVYAENNNIHFVVVGPEGPLVAGLTDKLKVRGIPVFGPSQAAARLEGSKSFMKELCRKYNIPTAAYARFTDYEAAAAYIKEQSLPIVIKADGLAAGKGVIIAETLEEALQAAEDMLSGESFGAAGAEIVIEEFLDGEEISFFALSDGKSVLPFNSAQDHKRAFDGDKGPNTGGMGAYSPARLMTPDLQNEIMETIICPTVKAMKTEGAPFSGVLFAGLMICKGKPYLIEYNVRFGDPECQTLMMRLESDLTALLLACAQEKLTEISRDGLKWSADPALCVVMAAKGYPGSYIKNTRIEGLEAARTYTNVQIFHAGTAQDTDGKIISIGGRVLGITARQSDIAGAQKTAYAAVDSIKWPDGFCRRDIGWRAL